MIFVIFGIFLFIVFFNQKPVYDMRISDWSSDVCSSDLVKLHSVIRLRERIIAILDQFGREALIGTLRSHLEDTETEMRRRIREMPDGTTRVLQFMDSSLRENAMQKISLAITVKDDRMILDFRGTAQIGREHV